MEKTGWEIARAERMKNMREAGKRMETIRTNIVTKLKNTCGMSVLLLHDVFNSCKNNVTSGQPETQAPHITRCHMLLLQTYAESHRHIFY